MSFVESPYAFKEGYDPDSGRLLYAEAGICRKKLKRRHSETEIKSGSASFNVEDTKARLNTSAEAGLYRVKKKKGNTEVETKLGSVFVGADLSLTGISASAQAEYCSISKRAKDSINIGDRKVDFTAEVAAKGPNVSAVVNVLPTRHWNAKVKAELLSASGRVGIFSGKVGLAADTGVSLGQAMEVSVMGVGVGLWPETSVSVFGSSLSIDTRKAVDTFISWLK